MSSPLLYGHALQCRTVSAKVVLLEFSVCQDLRPCVNLKWLSVVQNKLKTLKGVEALSNLTVSVSLDSQILSSYQNMSSNLCFC